MVGGIILAAGESRRMGSSKPLLPLGEKTFLSHLLEEFRASRARPIVVVLGHEAEKVLGETPLGEARPIVNQEYRQGMLSSVRAGLRVLADESVDGALVCPVDHPKVSAALIDGLIERFEETRRPVVVPVHQGWRGHPVLFSRTVFDELMTAPDSVGARYVVWNHRDDLLEVETDEAGSVLDIDTPDAFRDLTGRGRRDQEEV